MKNLILSLAFFTVSMAGHACSLTVTSENILGMEGSSACVKVSQPLKDAKGLYRTMSWEETTTFGQRVEHPTRIIRAGSRSVLLEKKIPGVGSYKVIELVAINHNKAEFVFLNGNKLGVSIDANGRINPARICVAQTAATQVRGYVNDCP